MREILFRGKIANISDPCDEWIKDGWVYGHLIGRDVIVGEITHFDDEGFATEFWYRVKPETVMQYTDNPELLEAKL